MVRLKEGKRGGLKIVRRANFGAIPVDIQLDCGMKASGREESGRKWEVTYKHPYGEIPRTQGRDGDPVDVYLGPCSPAEAPLVYVVHQVHHDGKFDEDKVMLGFKDPLEATRCYFEHGPQWGFGSLETMTLNQFIGGYLRATGSTEHGLAHIIGPGETF